MAAQGKQTSRKSTALEIIDKYFSAYMANDRNAIEECLSEDFTFTSPYDDHIDKAGYFEKCWHFSENNPYFRFVRLVEDGNDAFVLYECTLQSGDKFRNTGFFRLEGNKIREIEVYFGSLPAGRIL